MDWETLLQRLRTEPTRWLGAKSVTRLENFCVGYAAALHHHGKPPLTSLLSRRQFQDWAESRFHWTTEMGCCQNVESFALLFSSDEQAAFDFYFALRDVAIKESVHGTNCNADNSDGRSSAPSGTLVEWLYRTKQRPAMYFGNAGWVASLWTFSNGYLTAESDMGITETEDRKLLVDFQNWLEMRYPFAKGQPWDRIIEFLSLQSQNRAWDCFFDALDMFRAGEAPDALSKTGQLLLSNIVKAITAKNPAAQPERIVTTFQPEVKRICPS